MAFTEREQAIIRAGALSGKSAQEIRDAVTRERTGAGPRTEGVAPGGFVETVKDIPSDIGEFLGGVGRTFGEAFEEGQEIRERVETLETTPLKGTFEALGATGRGVARLAGEAITGVGKLFLSPRREEQIAGAVERGAKAVVETAPVQTLIEKYESLTPEQQRTVDATLGIAEGVATFLGARPATQTARTTIAEGRQAARTAMRFGEEQIRKGAERIREFEVPKIGSVTSLFKNKPKSVEDVVSKVVVTNIDDVTRQLDTLIAQGDSKGAVQAIQNLAVQSGRNVDEISSRLDNLIAQGNKVDAQKLVDEVVSAIKAQPEVNLGEVTKRMDTLISQGRAAEARALAEQTAPKITVRQKWAGVRPDIKRRIQGKQDLLREYFDVAHARNADDTLPTVYEYGGNFSHKAVDAMEEKLARTGGDIGVIRKKLGTIQAPRANVEQINNAFRNELTKLNLEIRDGQIIQISGTQSRLASSGDLRVINELNNELKVLNQNPSLTNIIDLRTTFDGKINFGKAQREVSNSVDPLSRTMRNRLKVASETIVGKTAAKDVERYSQFMNAFSDLKSYTDRRAGGEYLLRVALSGRGGEARQIVQTIKEHTGIDLLDHATMMQLATDIVANPAQQNLFRQEVTKAGLSVARIVGGDPRGFAEWVYQKGLDTILDAETLFLQAAE